MSEKLYLENLDEYVHDENRIVRKILKYIIFTLFCRPVIIVNLYSCNSEILLSDIWR